MKREIGEFWAASCKLLAGCFVAWLLGAWGALAYADTDRVLHITSAEMMRGSAPLTSTIDEASLTGPWVTVALPNTFGRPMRLTHPAHAAAGEAVPRTTTWYRVRLDALQDYRGKTDLYIVRWQSAGKIAVYGDSRLLYRSPGSPAWNKFRHAAVLIPLSLVTNSAPPKEILIRMDSMATGGGAISSLYVGDSDALFARYARHEWFEYQFPFLSGTAFLAVGFFAFLIWLLRRREPLYLLFFAIAALAAICRWHFYAELDRLSIPDEWFGWLTVNALAWLIPVMQRTFFELHDRRRPWLTRGFIGLALLCSIATLPFVPALPSLVLIKPMIFLGIISAAFVLAVVGLYDAWRCGSSDALLLIGWIGISVLLSINDWLITVHWLNFEQPFLSPYAAVGLFAIFAYIMSKRYVGAIEKVERFNAELEQRVRARETELVDSYRRLHEIEQHQALGLERQRLMQDMHDGMGSSLMSALRVVEHGQLDRAAVVDVLKGCIDDLKLMIDSTEPVQADLLLLLATLRYRLESRFESSGITLRWEVEDVPPLDWLDPVNALHILRILQEAFTNIIKHTRAREIRVATGVRDGGVVVTIADNGQGFSVEGAMRGSGRGLQNQLYRARAIGAAINWESCAEGSRLILWLPRHAGEPRREAATLNLIPQTLLDRGEPGGVRSVPQRRFTWETNSG